MMHLTLYSKEDCSLCDIAQTMIKQSYPTHSLNIIDITADPELWQKFRYSIPVLGINNDTQNTLNWPFTINELKQFIG